MQDVCVRRVYAHNTHQIIVCRVRESPIGEGVRVAWQAPSQDKMTTERCHYDVNLFDEVTPHATQDKTTRCHSPGTRDTRQSQHI